MGVIHGAARALETIPGWARMLVSVLATALGIYLIIRPTLSLGILALAIGAGFIVQGALLLVGQHRPNELASKWQLLGRQVEALAWCLAGLFVLVFPGLTVRLLVMFIAAGLFINGVRNIVETFGRDITLDSRIASGAFGVASVGFGLLALLWPDITLLIAAVVFGARLVIGGVTFGWQTMRMRTGEGKSQKAPKTANRFQRFAQSTVAIVVVVLVAIASTVSIGLRAESRVTDEFYAAPRVVPDTPGELIRAEPFTRDVPENATAWRILYTTTRGDGAPSVASGIVVVPNTGSGDWPVINWNHGTTGFAQPCAPSLLEEPFESGAMFILPEVIDSGWALVAPDYIGLGTQGPHPYLIGADSAHASLDAIRAAQQLNEAQLGAETVVWGHSQGGGAALWTGALAGDYAPELQINGVAALAPASNLVGLVQNLPNVTGGSVFASFVVAAYTATYPEITWREYIRPGAEATVRAMSQRCLASPDTLVSVLNVLAMNQDPEIFAKDPLTGPLKARIEENVPPAISSVPMLLAQGESDPLITPATQEIYVNEIRQDGSDVDYRIYAGRGHVELVEPDSPLIPELFDWTHQQFS